MLLDRLVQSYVQARSSGAAGVGRGRAAAQGLHDATQHHVRRVARPYPGVWFLGGQATPEALLDLADRVYFRCDRVALPGAPWEGRDPFGCYAADQLSHRQIALLTFYLPRSITRGVMRIDYEHNLVRDPVARWEAQLYRWAGEGLRAVAEAAPQRAGPPRWRLRGASLVPVRPPLPTLAARLRALPQPGPAAWARAALDETGALTQAQLAGVLRDVVPRPADPHPIAAEDAMDGAMDTRLLVRDAVLRAWRQLTPADRAVLTAVARGLTFAQIAGSEQAENVRKRLARINAALVRELRGEGAGGAGQVALAERIYEVLQLITPDEWEAG